MLRICYVLTKIIKLIFIFLIVLSFFISISFLQKHSFIFGKRKAESQNKIFERLALSNKETRIEDFINVGNSEVITMKRSDIVVHSKRLLKIDDETVVYKDLIDIMGKPPIKFIRHYKNPCFIGDDQNHLFNDGRLHCLPYFYLLGVKKSGTTDLFRRLSLHPDFRGPGFKEAQWFPRLRFGVHCRALKAHKVFKKLLHQGLDNRSVQYYISLFDAAAKTIRSCASTCITAEATPANLHMQPGWHLLPGNEGLKEPRYTTFHYIKHLTPAAKIIVIFRDPVTRLFSDHLHEAKMRNRNMSAERIEIMFKKQTTLLIEAYRACFETYSMRRCIYNNTLSDILIKRGMYLADSFRAGFYAFYMREIFSVFGKKQVLPILMTDYLTDIEKTLKETFSFLEMSPVPAELMSRIVNRRISNTAKTNGVAMTEDTKRMLYNFFTPFNTEMARLLKKPGYIFRQHNVTV